MKCERSPGIRPATVGGDGSASLALLAEHPLSKREFVGSNPTGGFLDMGGKLAYKQQCCLELASKPTDMNAADACSNSR